MLREVESGRFVVMALKILFAWYSMMTQPLRYTLNSLQNILSSSGCKYDDKLIVSKFLSLPSWLASFSPSLRAI